MKKYYSIKRLKLIKSNETNESKGYGFIEFNDYIEFQHALNNKEPIIFGKQKLIFNPAKNKYDNYNSIHMPNLINNDKNNNKYDIYNNYNYFISNKENININHRTKIENKNKFELYNNKNQEMQEKINIENCSLDEQIKYSLKNIAKNYSNNDDFLKSEICTYYCAPFIDKNILSTNKYFVSKK